MCGDSIQKQNEIIEEVHIQSETKIIDCSAQMAPSNTRIAPLFIKQEQESAHHWPRIAVRELHGEYPRDGLNTPHKDFFF